MPRELFSTHLRGVVIFLGRPFQDLSEGIHGLVFSPDALQLNTRLLDLIERVLKRARPPFGFVGVGWIRVAHKQLGYEVPPACQR